MSRVRIAYVLDQFATASAGTERQFLALVRGLDRARFEPHVFLLRGDPGMLGRELPDVAIDVLGVRKLAHPRSLAAIAAFALRLRRQRFAVAHLYFNDTSVLLPWPLKLAGLPVVVSRRDLGFWYTPGILKALRIQSRAAAAVVANSAAVRQRVCEAEGFRPDRVHVIYNGLDVRADVVSRDAARRLLDIPPESRVLVVVANVKPLKRVSDVVSALPRIRARHPSTRLIVVGADTPGRGGGSHTAELRQLAAEAGVDATVHFVGAHAEPGLYVAAADVCLLCSETEGLSNAVIEYMLAARPVVATRVGGNPELIGTPQCGELVDVGAPEQIAAAVLRYLDDEKLRDAHGDSGRQSAMLRFSREAMLAAHESLYKKLA
jgi:glycosyltransferase involved in cell wall biosynthesis